MSWPRGIDRQTLLSTFLAESVSGCLSMGDALRQLEDRPFDEGARRRLVCLVHSLKGNAKLFGFQDLAGRVQVVENLLENAQLPWPTEIRDLLAATTAALRTIVPRVVEGGEELLPKERILFDGLEQAARGWRCPGVRKPAEEALPPWRE